MGVRIVLKVVQTLNVSPATLTRGLETVANGNSLFLDKLFPDKGFAAAERDLAVDKNYLGGMIREQGAAIEYGCNIAGSVRSLPFVLHSILVKREMMGREKVVTTKFSKLGTFGNKERDITEVCMRLLGLHNTRIRIVSFFGAIKRIKG
eukprot:1094816-Ditylum_brightwellii.AAC.1